MRAFLVVSLRSISRAQHLTRSNFDGKDVGHAEAEYVICLARVDVAHRNKEKIWKYSMWFRMWEMDGWAQWRRHNGAGPRGAVNARA